MWSYMYVCIHVCIYVIFKLGFERYGGNCPSWEGELSGGIVRGGSVRGELSRGEMSGPHTSRTPQFLVVRKTRKTPCTKSCPILWFARIHLLEQKVKHH